MTERSPLDEGRLDALRLHLVAGIGPRMHQLLLGRFGCAGAVLSASLEELMQVPGVGRKVSRAINEARCSSDAQRERELVERRGFSLLYRDAPGFPRPLLETHDAPAVLYCRGEISQQDDLAVAIVGSRRCTHYGRRQTERLATALARAGMTIVSGLARGIDGVAHRAAVNAGGRTIAVSATGLNHVYPPEHVELAAEVVGSGAILSESRLDQPPLAGMFPQRNRIISGLSLGVIVIEANRKSGALHTARHAMEQGREVLAVPGNIDSLASRGCLDLIRDGATLVRGPDDVFEALGPLIEPVKDPLTGEIHSPRELTLSDQEQSILGLVSSEPRHMDEILRTAALDSSRVLATVTVLEMKRLIRRLPGGYLVRRSG